MALLTPNRQFIKNGLSTLLDLVLPPRCPVTGQLVGTQGSVAPEFWAQLNFLHGSLCVCCGKPFPHDVAGELKCTSCLQDPPPYSRARAAMVYDDASAKLILKFKHGDGSHLTPSLVSFLRMAGSDLIAQSDMIIPVPLHRWRLLKRRYNQASLLSAALARMENKTHLPHALRRMRATESQGHKTSVQRFDNIKGAFDMHARDTRRIAGKTILLIDDVMTSGATIHACTKTLLHAGASTVNVLTVARVR